MGDLRFSAAGVGQRNEGVIIDATQFEVNGLSKGLFSADRLRSQDIFCISRKQHLRSGQKRNKAGNVVRAISWGDHQVLRREGKLIEFLRRISLKGIEG